MPTRERLAADLSIFVCSPPPAFRRRGNASRALILILGLAGVALTALALLMPVTWQALDPAVLERSARGTPSFAETAAQWETAGKPGTAALFRRAMDQLNGGQPAQPPPAGETGDDPARAWGGDDPFLTRIFPDGPPRARDLRPHPPVIPLFVPPEARRQLGDFMRHTRHTGAQTILANRSVDHAERFMPAGSASGQPLEATLYLTALLLQGNHFSPQMAERLRALAAEANENNRLGTGLETLYLDLFALGVRLPWQALADLLPLLETPEELRRVAHLAQLMEDDWPLFYAAAIWTRAPGELSTFLVGHGQSGVDDLKEAMRHGQGAVTTLARGGKPVRAPDWRSGLPFAPPLTDLVWQSAEVASALKIALLFGGMLAVFLAFNLFFQTLPSPAPDRPIGLTLLQSMLIAAAFSVVALILSEPFAFDEGRTSEYRMETPFTLAPSAAAVPLEETTSFPMDQITLTALAIFFILQLIIYLICWIKIFEIRRQPVGSNLKLKLLENEENLFDAGLYVGLGGTVVALILLAVGFIEDAALMAAYASTLFGIVFVAFFKICHLRPFRRRLIIDNQSRGF